MENLTNSVFAFDLVLAFSSKMSHILKIDILKNICSKSCLFCFTFHLDLWAPAKRSSYPHHLILANPVYFATSEFWNTYKNINLRVFLLRFICYFKTRFKGDLHFNFSYCLMRWLNFPYLAIFNNLKLWITVTSSQWWFQVDLFMELLNIVIFISDKIQLNCQKGIFCSQWNHSCHCNDCWSVKWLVYIFINLYYIFYDLYNFHRKKE